MWGHMGQGKTDTASAIEAMRSTGFRQMTPAQKFALAGALTRNVRQLALAGIRLRYPGIDEQYHASYYTDSVHPNDSGLAQMARLHAISMSLGWSGHHSEIRWSPSLGTKFGILENPPGIRITASSELWRRRRRSRRCLRSIPKRREEGQ